MLTSFFARGMAVAVMSLCFYANAFAIKGYIGPDDPTATSAAQEALKALGPDKGAIPFTGSCVDIIGLESVRLSGTTAEIDQAMKDLGAKQVGMEIQISLSGDVLFDFDKWDIKKEAEQTLKKLAKLIGDLKKRHIIIEGHTDAKGSGAYNFKLSLKRATAVRDWFTQKGKLKHVQFEVKGYGEARPVLPNVRPDGSDNPEGRAANRRVEIRILK